MQHSPRGPAQEVHEAAQEPGQEGQEDGGAGQRAEQPHELLVVELAGRPPQEPGEEAQDEGRARHHRTCRGRSR